MRIIPTGIHAVMDYLLGIILVGTPFVLGFAPGFAAEDALVDPWATYIMVVLGFALIIYSLLTDYELSLVALIPMRVHLGLDGLSGALLAVSPWLFGFVSFVFLPHVVLGAIEILAALMTDPTPYRKRRAARGIDARR